MDLTEDMRDLLKLHLIPGLGPRLTAALLERFGSAAAALRARTAELQQVPHIGANLASKLRQAIDTLDVQAEIDRLIEHGVTLLRRGHGDYPPALAQIAGAPELLYVKGRIEPRDAEAVAIVGSRFCTSYGKKTAEKMAGDLARAGFTIVSGLARGIDGAVHRGALEAGGRTLAVLAGGLSRIYPPEHRELAEQVKDQGALLSESAMKMEPMAVLFPARNRIISGLSRGVVVIEAGEKSGALITATHAAEQGREVFAVPGAVDSTASAGTLQLLRKGAKVVRHAQDVIEDLRGIAPLVTPTQATAEAAAQPPPGLDPLQLRIWELLAQPTYVDDIARRIDVPVAELTRSLMLIEMKRVIRRLPGNQYERW
ncbi:MAG: DNA-protecting protein DprA [Planctomycetes bacterium]|nr:DNA-protecting protein DprA [Planctomycetota bacterium]